VQRFGGVVPPFVGVVAIVSAILVGFLANDVWDRNQRAGAAVRAEAAILFSMPFPKP
jgi:hypothetical protein